MNTPKSLYALLALLAACWPTAAGSAPLTVVNVSAPQVLCVFNTTCHTSGTDTSGTYAATPPNQHNGVELLQTRTIVGGAGTPSQGKIIYLYRVDFSQAQPIADQHCAIDLKLAFGAISKLPYNGGPPADVFVITSGGLGNIGLASADESPIGFITFTFTANPLPVCPGESSFFFGLASAAPPRDVVAQSDLNFGGGPANADARVPWAYIHVKRPAK